LIELSLYPRWLMVACSRACRGLHLVAQEDQAATLRVWSPGIVHGLLQTEDYARALLSTYPGVTAEALL
jgi:hypothetical protein